MNFKIEKILNNDLLIKYNNIALYFKLIKLQILPLFGNNHLYNLETLELKVYIYYFIWLFFHIEVEIIKQND